MRTIEKRQEMKPIEMKLARRLGGVGEYYFSKKLREIDRMRASGRQIINLGIGSPDRPPHPDVIGTLAAEAAKPGNHGYQPYKGAAVLREAFALWYKERYGVALDPEGEILPLIGSKEGVMHVCMTYLDEGDRVLVPNPGYPTYRSAVTIAGGVCVDYVLREDGGWMPDFDEIERGGLQGVKMMIVNYPHMPTGAAPKEGLFRRLVDFARRHGILLLHDNPYSFLRNDRPESLLATPGATEVALELNSLSKSHCMAGWRIGMIGHVLSAAGRCRESPVAGRRLVSGAQCAVPPPRGQGLRDTRRGRLHLRSRSGGAVRLGTAPRGSRRLL